MLDCYSRWRTGQLTAEGSAPTSKRGTGHRTRQVLTTDTMYVGLLAIAVLGFVFSLVLDEIERMLTPWKANARGVRCPRRYALRMEISAG
jgi:hypothetical protein